MACIRFHSDFFFKFNQVIYSSSPISWPSFKPLDQLTKFQAPSSNTFRDILLTRFHSDFSKVHNSRKGDNSSKKKLCISYFSMRNPYMKFQNPSIHGFFFFTNGRTHGRTDGQPETNMLPQFLRGWGHNEEENMAINRYWVDSMTCSLSHVIQSKKIRNWYNQIQSYIIFIYNILWFV